MTNFKCQNKPKWLNPKLLYLDFGFALAFELRILCFLIDSFYIRP